MKSFNQFLNEVISYKDNHSFAIGPNNFYDEKVSNSTEHPELFPHLNFMGRRESSRNKPMAKVWGRIDHNNNNVHFVTQHGMPVYGESDGRVRNKKDLETDVFNRLDAVNKVRERYPSYSVHHGFITSESGERTPRLVSYHEYEKHLTGILKDNL